MKLTVLVDNNTYIDEYYYGEPGVCYHIEDEGKRILFDLGYSDVFLKNAEKMGIDLHLTDTVVFSHGHNDHTGGFRPFLQYLYPQRLKRKTLKMNRSDSIESPKEAESELSDESVSYRRIRLVAHPDCFEQKRYDGLSIGTDISVEEAEQFCDLQLSKEPVRVSENIWFLGGIPQLHDFEKRNAIGEKRIGEKRIGGSPAELVSCEPIWAEDFCAEDSALVYKNGENLFVITGCSHSGICNIVSYAERLFAGCSVRGILGGFHLFETDERTRKTVEFLREKNLEELLPCHCVSLAVKCEMSRSMPVREVGVGMCLEI